MPLEVWKVSDFPLTRVSRWATPCRGPSPQLEVRATRGKAQPFHTTGGRATRSEYLTVLMKTSTKISSRCLSCWVLPSFIVGKISINSLSEKKYIRIWLGQFRLARKLEVSAVVKKELRTSTNSRLRKHQYR